jgi:hypothetical protein
MSRLAVAPGQLVGAAATQRLPSTGALSELATKASTYASSAPSWDRVPRADPSGYMSCGARKLCVCMGSCDGWLAVPGDGSTASQMWGDSICIAVLSSCPLCVPVHAVHSRSTARQQQQQAALLPPQPPPVLSARDPAPGGRRLWQQHTGATTAVDAAGVLGSSSRWNIAHVAALVWQLGMHGNSTQGNHWLVLYACVCQCMLCKLVLSV